MFRVHQQNVPRFHVDLHAVCGLPPICVLAERSRCAQCFRRTQVPCFGAADLKVPRAVVPDRVGVFGPSHHPLPCFVAPYKNPHGFPVTQGCSRSGVGRQFTDEATAGDKLFHECFGFQDERGVPFAWEWWIMVVIGGSGPWVGAQDVQGLQGGVVHCQFQIPRLF